MHSPPDTGPGGDDLSISELSLSDRPSNSPFTLLARPAADPSTPVRREDDPGAEDGVDDHDQEDAGPEKAKRLEARLREEKLQSDAFILRKLNASFALFNEALAKTETANECLAMRLEQTDTLLTKYVNILSKSEQSARLILDEMWLGSEDDEEVLHLEAENKARREAEARLRAVQQAQEQREREAREKAEREEKERLEKEKKESTVARGGVRGVRGTRASMRGARGSTAARASTGTGQPSSTWSSVAATGIKKPASGRPSGLPTRTVRGS